MQKLLLTIFGLILLPVAMFAQRGSNGNYAKIEGVVLEASGGEQPINFATVQLLPQGTYVSTDANGNFSFAKVHPGKVQIKVQFVGMQDIDTTVNVIAAKDYYFEFKMKEANFKLTEIIVSAKRSQAGSSTASNINRQAMDHLQASTIKDVMQLLPGVTISNPNLNSANTISIRTLTGDAMNSLGTAVIIDGSPLSNNANLQRLSASANGGSGATGSGVDLRKVSLDNVESVEVIRGIPSVEYGDLTSGAVIINSKAGREPLSVRFKTNPKLYEVSASKGFNVGKKGGAFHISGNYAYSNSEQTDTYQYYQRYNVRGMYSQSFGKLSTNTSLDLQIGKDSRDKNPDDKRNQRASSGRDVGFRFNTNGTLNFDNAGWLKTFKYSASFSYTDRKSWSEELLGNAFAPYSTAMVDGAVISNTPGGKVYDANGKEITNLKGTNSTDFATYLPYEYFSHYDIYGKELNAFAKINANFVKMWNSGNNKILVGVDFKTDGNLGKGVVYDLNTPPQRLNANGGPAWRPRAFKDVPFITQIGAYIENHFTQKFGEKERALNITAGIRYDNVNGKDSFSPRINASFELFPRVVIIRGGYGIASKAPTAMYLYPQKAYFDYINFNNLGDEKYAPSEQLLLATTRVYDVKNKDLKVAKNYKAEVGLYIKFTKKISLSLTGYSEKLRNGYALGMDINDWKLIPYTQYKVAEKVEGAAPKLEVDQTYNIFLSYYKPMNTGVYNNKGLEYILDFGRIDAIRTSINVSGAYMRSEVTSDNYSYSTNSNSGKLERNIGVYEKRLTTGIAEQFNTTFRITHNIPKIGFVLTLASEIIWKDKSWTKYGNDTMFEKYISRKDGKIYNFDPKMKDDPEFSYLFDTRLDNRFIAESLKPRVIFNFQLSKEIGNFLTASFFVNNLFNHRQLYESKKYPGSYDEVGIPTFFGFDVKINIK